METNCEANLLHIVSKNKKKYREYYFIVEKPSWAVLFLHLGNYKLITLLRMC